MDVGRLVDDRPERGRFRVHRSAMMSRGIYELEQRRIFDRPLRRSVFAPLPRTE